MYLWYILYLDWEWFCGHFCDSVYLVMTSSISHVSMIYSVPWLRMILWTLLWQCVSCYDIIHISCIYDIFCTLIENDFVDTSVTVCILLWHHPYLMYLWYILYLDWEWFCGHFCDSVYLVMTSPISHVSMIYSVPWLRMILWTLLWQCVSCYDIIHISCIYDIFCTLIENDFMDTSVTVCILLWQHPYLMYLWYILHLDWEWFYGHFCDSVYLVRTSSISHVSMIYSAPWLRMILWTLLWQCVSC